MAKPVELVLRQLERSGDGFPWVMRMLKPWSGDNDCAQFEKGVVVTGEHNRLYRRFVLKGPGVFYVNRPIRKWVAEDLPEDESCEGIDKERFYFQIDEAGHPRRVAYSKAVAILKAELWSSDDYEDVEDI